MRLTYFLPDIATTQHGTRVIKKHLLAPPAGRWPRALFGATVIGLVLLGAATAHAAPNWWTPSQDISVEGYRFDRLFLFVTAMLTFLFLGMTGIIVYSMVSFRESRGAKAHYDHGGSRRDVLIEIAISTTIFLVVDGVLLVRSHIDINEVIWKMPAASANVLRIQVMPQQWAWNFRYPGDDNEFNTPDDVVVLDELRVPTGRPVHLQLKSKDVIHSLFLPNVRQKRDANPGAVSEMWFEVTQPGDYEILCAEMCGYAHYQMRGQFLVRTPTEFDQWYREASAWGRVQYVSDATDQHWGWEWKEL